MWGVLFRILSESKSVFSPNTSSGQFITLSNYISPFVVKTTGGDYLISWRLGGLLFVGRDKQEVEHKHNTFSRLLRTLRTPDYVNVAFWVHDVRRRGKVRLDTEFTERFNQGVQDQYFYSLTTQKIINSELYFTILYRPMVASKDFADRPSEVSILEHMQNQAIEKITELAANVEAVLRNCTPYRLGIYKGKNGVVFSETLELYVYLLNRIEEPVPVLNAPVHDYLTVSRQTFSPKDRGFIVTTPDQKNYFGATLNIKEYPDNTWPGILNGLKYLDFEYVITHSFSPKGRHDALKTLGRIRGMMVSSDDKAVSQISELDRTMDEVSSGNFVLGEHHFTIALYAESQRKLHQHVVTARAELSNAGFVSAKEDVTIIASFYSRLADNWKYRTRLANVSSLNFLGLSPLHNSSTDKMHSNPWDDTVTVLQTTNGQPYYFNFHATHPSKNSLEEKAIVNTVVVDKSGTGKTTLIDLLLSQVQKFDPESTVFFFDKDRGAEIFVKACGGNYTVLDNDQSTSFDPFQCKSNEISIQFLTGLIKLITDKEECTASEEEDTMRAVKAILDTPLRLRTITSFQKSLPDLGDDSVFARIHE